MNREGNNQLMARDQLGKIDHDEWCTEVRQSGVHYLHYPNLHSCF